MEMMGLVSPVGSRLLSKLSFLLNVRHLLVMQDVVQSDDPVVMYFAMQCHRRAVFRVFHQRRSLLSGIVEEVD